MIIKKVSLFVYPAVCICLLVFAHNAQAINHAASLENLIRDLSPDYELPVIIHMSEKAAIDFITGKDKRIRTKKIVSALKDKAKGTQEQLRSFLEMRKAKKIKSLWIINGIAVTVPVRLVPDLEKFPGVESVEQDYTVHAPVVKFGSTALPGSNLEAIKAQEVWNLGDTGAGTVVASIDTGVDINHPDLGGEWRGGTNSWYDPNGEHSSPYDADGHGTMITGIMAGGSSGGTAIGVAPDSKWIAVKIFNDKGDSTSSNIHEGFQWLLDPDGNPDTDDAPDVVNASWGLEDSSGKCNLAFQQDVQSLRAAGIAVVFAAGNDGAPSLPSMNTSESPANNPGSFPVGAVDSNNMIASFSSRGPSACDGSIYPQVVAPGVDIRTSDLTGGGAFPNSYVNVSGTSFASPHAAGAIALLKSAFPGRTIEEIELSLEQSATDLGVTGSDNAYGYGLINILKAYNILLANNPPGPKIEGSPASYDFWETETVAGSLTTFFLFTNIGQTDLQIGTASLGGTNPADFNISSDNCSGMTIGPQLSCAVGIYFAPSSAGVKNARLSVPSNDPGTPVLTILLKGTGVAPQPITLTSPNGAENWTIGEARTIQWKLSGNPGRFVKIELLKGGVLNRTIKSRISAEAGSYTWTIPAKQNPGNDYRIRIRSTTNVAYTDTSDSDFSVVLPPPPSITVTNPQGGENWQRGSSQVIDWTYAGKIGTYVKIQLFRGGTLIRTISSSVKIGSNGRGSFIWRIPANLTPGDAYQVKVISKSKGTINDMSNGTFTIQ